MKSLKQTIAEAKQKTVKQWTNKGLLAKDLVQLPIGTKVKAIDTAFGLMQTKFKTVQLPIGTEYEIASTNDNYGRGFKYVRLKPVDSDSKESYSMILDPEQFSGVEKVK